MSFVHVGYGNMVNTDRIMAVVRPNTQNGKRYQKGAKTHHLYIDATAGRAVRALLLLDNNYVMGSGISLKTLLKRLNGYIPNELTDQDESPDVHEAYLEEEDVPESTEETVEDTEEEDNDEDY